MGHIDHAALVAGDSLGALAEAIDDEFAVQALLGQGADL
jgi:hypothetical protein